jgi:hypothetical protein
VRGRGRGRVFWKNKEKDRRTKRRTGNFFFFERENGNGEGTEMALAILENKIKTEKRGEDLEAKVFDRMPQREVGLFRKKKKKLGTVILNNLAAKSIFYLDDFLRF